MNQERQRFLLRFCKERLKEIENPSLMAEALNLLLDYLSDELSGRILHLEVPLGTEVWKVVDNPKYHQGIRQAELFLYGELHTPDKLCRAVPFEISMVEHWGQTVFRTEEEAEKSIAKVNINH